MRPSGSDAIRPPLALAFAPNRHRPKRRQTHRRARLIVVEDGTTGFEMHISPDGTDQTVVVAQYGGETLAEFAYRTVRRILVLEQSHRSIERTIVLLAPRFDLEATAARLLLARALMTHSAATNDGASELVLSTGTGGGLQPGQGLLTLIDALIGEPGSCSLPVSVC